MNVYVVASIQNRKEYLHSLYPVAWAPFISGAYKFSSISEARQQMNFIYKHLFGNEDGFDVNALYSIKFITINNGNCIDEQTYLTRE